METASRPLKLMAYSISFGDTMTPTPNTNSPKIDTSSIDKLPSLPIVTMTKDTVEKKKEEKEKIDKNVLKLFVKNSFKSIALFAGEHWDLNKEDLDDVTNALHPVANKYWESITKYFSELNLALTLLRVCAPKVKISIEKMKAKKEEQAKKLVDKQLKDGGWVKPSKDIDDNDDEIEEPKEEKPRTISRKNKPIVKEGDFSVE